MMTTALSEKRHGEAHLLGFIMGRAARFVCQLCASSEMNAKCQRHAGSFHPIFKSFGAPGSYFLFAAI